MSPRRRRASAKSEETTNIILESISDGVFTIDHQWRITSFNRAAERITGVTRKQALGKRCAEVFHAAFCAEGCLLRETMQSGKAQINGTTTIQRADGKRIPISISTSLLRDTSGRVVGGVETFRDLSLIEDLRRELSRETVLGDIVTRSPRMRALLDILPQVARSDASVLIQGETGTGKELLARSIHAHSPRRKGPFVAVNCGALPDTLLESELFGYKAGAFTGAHRDKPGRFAMAEGGTLFLDEIGDISPALQVKLLRVLQERCYEPLGSNRAIKADVRLITATHRALDELLSQDLFRQDLYYRINVVRMEIPPLRARREDIPLLCEHFIARFNKIQNKNVSGLSHEALSLLMNYAFLGNVRELAHMIEHAFVLVGEGPITPAHLPQQLLPVPGQIGTKRPRDLVQTMEARVIEETLRQHGFNKTRAAKELGMHKSTLFRKIASLGIRDQARVRRHSDD